MFYTIRKLLGRQTKEELEERLLELTQKDFFSAKEIKDIENLIKKNGFCIDFENRKTGCTLLLIAIKSKEEDLVRKLLGVGADPNYYSERLQTSPLIWSVRYQETECIRLLLEHGADPTLHDKDGQAAIHTAVWNQAASSNDQENLNILRLLSQKSVDVREKRHGRTALMLAANYGLFDVVDLLLENGANHRLEDDAGMTAYKFVEESVWMKSEYKRKECMARLRIRRYQEHRNKI